VNTNHSGECTVSGVTYTSLTWWRNVDVNEIAPCTWHCHTGTERNTKVHPPEMWPSNLPDLNLGLQRVRYHSIRGSMTWRSWKNVCWLLSEWRL